jgi:hypothetical protein
MRLYSVTAGSSTRAMIRTGSTQAAQVSMPMSNTPFNPYAEVIENRHPRCKLLRIVCHALLTSLTRPRVHHPPPVPAVGSKYPLEMHQVDAGLSHHSVRLGDEVQQLEKIFLGAKLPRSTADWPRKHPSPLGKALCK